MGKPTNQPNNVWADKNGNVYQRDKSGNIQQNKGGNTWSKPNQPSVSNTMPNTTGNRDRGSNKMNNYNQYNRPSAPSARPAPRPAPSARPSGGVRRR
jgi:hypothetical protein